MEYNTGDFRKEINENGILFDIGSLYQYLERLSDIRKPRGLRYRLATILVLIILAKLGGEDHPTGIAEWAKHREKQLVQVLKLPYPKVPHHSTYRRILGEVIDSEEFEQLAGAFLASQSQSGHSVVIAIDGKTLRGTIPAGETHGVHLLAAYLPEEGLVLMQVEVDSKENEIRAAPRLLACLDLRGKVVMGDALHTQREVSAQILAAGGDYLWIVKENQPRLREDLEKLFAPEITRPGLGKVGNDLQTASSTNNRHGRMEKRRITTSSLLNDYCDWPGLAQVFKLERHRERLVTGEVSEEIIYGITSLAKDKSSPRQLLTLVRSYWGIENGLHYRRDVTFKEDRTHMKVSNAAHALAIINNLVIGLLMKSGERNLASARRKYCAKPQEALALILGTNP